jgi:hypothetical protein
MKKKKMKIEEREEHVLLIGQYYLKKISKCNHNTNIINKKNIKRKQLANDL